MRHAAFLGTPRRFHYVAPLDGLLIAPVHRIEDNWPGGYRLYGAGRNEGATGLNTSGQRQLMNMGKRGLRRRLVVCYRTDDR
jgi:hypothetical protein